MSLPRGEAAHAAVEAEQEALADYFMATMGSTWRPWSCGLCARSTVCVGCQVRIDAAEAEAGGHNALGGEWEAGQDRYERALDEAGGSR